MQTLPAPRQLILEQLERMLASDTFAGAERSRVLLKFLVEHVLENQPDRLKEYTIGSEALRRGDSFDPRIDPIVRAEASRLRGRIERYYATSGAADTVLITLPKGSYVPHLQKRAIPETVPVAAPAGGPLSKAGRLQKFIWFVVGGITVGAAAILFVSTTDPDKPTVEFGGDVDLGGAGYSVGSEFGNDVILSPDGTRIVFVALGSDHVLRLMTRRLEPGQRTIDQLPETEGARAPFFSPDGRSVGFWDQSDGKLKMVSIDGGSPIVITEAVNFGGGSWGKNGDIIAAIDGVLKRVPPSGAAEVIADLAKERATPSWPDLLPGGEHVLFTAVGAHGPDASNLEVLSLKDGTRRPLPVRAGFGRYLSAGYLLYVNQGTLFAVPFDLQQLTVQGTGVPVLDERVAYSTIFGNAKFDISRNGTLIYRGSPPLVASWLNRGGGTDPLLAKPGAYTFPRLSQNGRRLAINVTERGVLRTDVYDIAVRPPAPQRLPATPGSMSAVWHPDGFLVVGGRTGMSWTRADDMSKLETLTPGSSVQIPWSFTANGTRLAYIEASTSLDIYTIPVSHSGGRLTAGKPEPFLKTPSFESAPSFSPDGRWLMYGSGASSRWNVYVRAFPPDGSSEIQVSQGGGGRIGRWLSNGRELVYRTDDQRLMVVEHQVKNGTFIAGKPKEWTDVRLADTGVISNFDVSGDRVVGLVPASREEAERMRTQATVIPRFADEIRRRLARSEK